MGYYKDLQLATVSDKGFHFDGCRCSECTESRRLSEQWARLDFSSLDTPQAAPPPPTQGDPSRFGARVPCDVCGTGTAYYNPDRVVQECPVCRRKAKLAYLGVKESR